MQRSPSDFSFHPADDRSRCVEPTPRPTEIAPVLRWWPACRLRPPPSSRRRRFARQPWTHPSDGVRHVRPAAGAPRVRGAGVPYTLVRPGPVTGTMPGIRAWMWLKGYSAMRAPLADSTTTDPVLFYPPAPPCWRGRPLSPSPHGNPLSLPPDVPHHPQPHHRWRPAPPRAPEPPPLAAVRPSDLLCVVAGGHGKS